jgi:hypothetical protein
MTVSVPTTAIEAIKIALDKERQALGFTSDVQLARHYGVTPKIISGMRNGKLTRIDAILVNLLTIGLTDTKQVHRSTAQHSTAPVEKP